MGFKVSAKRCNECLFSSAKIVDEERAAEVLAECEAEDAHFICHKFTIEALEGRATEDEANVCCRGFYDRDPYATNLMRIAARLHAIEFVELPESKE